MENKTILNIIFISLLVLYLSAFTFVMVVYVAPAVRRRKKNNKDTEIQIPIVCSYSNTDFYKKSVEHSEKVLFNKIFDPQYGEKNYYGNKLIDTISKINNDTKQSIIIAIQYFSIEPLQARNNEQLFRMMSEQENIPLWFVILREATKKVIPEFINENNMQSENKIVPLYQKTG